MAIFQHKIYLDYAATTPLDRGVFKKMEPYFLEKYGNPASIHSFGQEAQKAVDEARGRLALFLNCSPSEVIFTSGATEANNLAIKCAVSACDAKKSERGVKPHLIVSRVEHHCVLDTVSGLAEDGLVEVSYLSVDSDGIVKLDELKSLLKDNTILVSIMYANNETGVISPIVEIGKFLSDKQSIFGHKILFHTDATQAVNYLNCRVDELGVDLLSLSGRKIYGPNGVVALYVKKGSPIARIQDGGSQEYNLRAGTLNVPGIVGLGEAIVTNNQQLITNNRIKTLRDKLVEGILRNIKDTALNGSREQRLSNNANIRFLGAEGEAILLSLDLEGIAVSTASACASRSLKPSHVLTAMGLAGFDAHSSVRFSLGKDTTETEIDRVIAILPPIIERLRKIGGEYSKKEQKRLPDDFGC